MGMTMLVSQDGQDFGRFFCWVLWNLFFIIVLGWFCLIFHCFNSFLYKAFSFLPNLSHFCLKEALGQTFTYERNIIKTSGFFSAKHIWDGKSRIDLKSIFITSLSWEKPRPITCTTHPQRSAATQTVPTTHPRDDSLPFLG